MCILVVEDDALIRAILVEELIDAGYEVREADSADRALQMASSLTPPLRLLVTDIHMPGGRSGLDVAQHVRSNMPHVPVIFTTGRPDALTHLKSLGKKQVLIRKPYTAQQVIESIRHLLAA